MKVIFVLFVFLSLSLPAFAGQLTLDNATHTASIEIAQKVPAQSSLAVVSIKSLSDDLSLHIITLLETELVNTDKLSMVSRQRVNAVLDEQNFGVSGYVDDNSAQKIGHLLGAKYVMTGELTKPESKYYLNLQVLETETARLAYSHSFEIRNSELRKYEQLIAAREKLAQLERERLLRDEERRQQRELDRIAARERKIKRDNFIQAISPDLNFGNWSPVSTMRFEIGYNFTPDAPLGFIIGGAGIYASLNFGIPSWQGYDKEYFEKYNSDGRIGNYYSSYEDYTDRGNRAYENIQWSVGYSFNIINNFILLPVGVGAEHTNEFRLYDEWSVSSFSPYSRELKSTEWYGSTEWTSKLILEAGIQIIIKHITFYGLYRSIGFEENSFVAGGGYIF